MNYNFNDQSFCYLHFYSRIAHCHNNFIILIWACLGLSLQFWSFFFSQKWWFTISTVERRYCTMNNLSKNNDIFEIIEPALKNTMQNDLNSILNDDNTERNSSNTQFNLNEQLAMTADRRQNLKKKTKFLRLNAEIQILQKEINASFMTNKKWQTVIETSKIIFNVEMITRSKRIFKFKKLFQYSGKSIREHIDYIWNYIMTFRLIFKEFQTKNFKIIFVIQTLADESKESWYCFEKNHSDHRYTFKNYSDFLLNFVENPMNCQFHSVQLFNDAKQLKKQLIHAFNAYFSSLKVQLSSYTEKQKRIHFFTKLKSSIKIVLTNYQNLSSIKKNLLSLTARLKNNIKMKKKNNIINFFNQFNQSANKFGKNEKPNKKNWKKKFDSNKPVKSEEKQQETKWKNRKKRKENDSSILCFHCKKLDHVKQKCSNLKKKKNTLDKNKKKMVFSR